MSKGKGSGVWVRLDPEERQEIEDAAKASGTFNMSEIIRQRLFRDPIAVMDRRIALLERRSLTQVACENLIVELIESLVPKEHRIGKVGIQNRLNTIKAKIINAESATINMQFEQVEDNE